MEEEDDEVRDVAVMDGGGGLDRGGRGEGYGRSASALKKKRWGLV